MKRKSHLHPCIGIPPAEREHQAFNAHLALSELDHDPDRAHRELRAIAAVVGVLVDEHDDDGRQAVLEALQALNQHRQGQCTTEAARAAAGPLVGLYEHLLMRVTFRKLLMALAAAQRALA